MTIGHGYSPWGQVQNSRELVPGVYEVQTAGHGGIMARANVASRLLSPEALKEAGFFQNGWYCYEEDCDAQVVLRELLDKDLISAPSYWQKTPEEYSACISRIVKENHPEYWAARETRLAAAEQAMQRYTVALTELAQRVVSVEVAAESRSAAIDVVERNCSGQSIPEGWDLVPSDIQVLSERPMAEWSEPEQADDDEWER